jgi:hypothetical protein
MLSTYILATITPGGDGVLRSTRELTLFVLSLPCSLLVVELHGVYQRDEQRSLHDR